MNWLRAPLNRALAVKKLNQKDIAKKLGLPNSFVSSVMSKDAVYDFGKVALIIDELIDSPVERKELSLHYYRLTVKPKALRSAYEWLWFNHELSELKRLIRRNTDKDFNEIYKLMIARSKRFRIKNENLRERFLCRLLDRAASLKTRSKDALVKCLCINFQIYTYGDLKQYARMDALYQGLILTSIKNYPYFVYSLSIQSKDQMSIKHWKQNNLQESRKLLEELISNVGNQRMLGNIYHRLGMTYCLEDFDKSLEYVEKSIEIFQASGYETLALAIRKSNIPFIFSLFGRTWDSTDDIIELAHNYISVGKTKLGINLLENSDLSSPYICYYLGKAKRSEELLTKSHEIFRKQGDHFFANLPMREMKKMNREVQHV